MRIFGKGTRGCYYPVPVATEGGIGGSLVLPSSTGGRLPTATSTPGAPVVLTNFSFNLHERSQTLSCFGGKNYVYAFGHDPDSNATASFVCMLRQRNGDPSAALSVVVDEYRASRLSASRAPAFMLIFGHRQILRGFVVGMQSATVNVETSLQEVRFSLMIPEITI